MNVIGVVGAGVMGRGITQALISSGFEVLLYDENDANTHKSIHIMERECRMLHMTRKIISDWVELQSKVNVVTNLSGLEDCDYIIECITENINIKKTFYQKIDRIAKEESIFLSNTSCISITKIASFTKRPDKIIGTHFMNPVYLINAVEVIRGSFTSNYTILKTQKLLKSMGKKEIIVNDQPGFVSNKISHLMINEASFIILDQVADIESVDAIFKQCYGHKMGPLETADLIGIDTVVNSLQVLYDSYQDNKYLCCPLLKKMVDEGLLGRKSGKGFYSY